MKKVLFVAMFFTLTLLMTGCGETALTELPEAKEGIYLGNCPYSATPNTCYIYKFEGSTMKSRLCNLKYNKNIEKSNCEFDEEGVGALYITDTYDIKDLDFSTSDGEDGSFNVYNKDGEKKYECNTGFGKIYCDTSTGGSFKLTKQN